MSLKSEILCWYPCLSRVIAPLAVADKGLKLIKCFRALVYRISKHLCFPSLAS